MTYQIVYKETLCGDYIIDAASEEEALKEFDRLMECGQIDTLDLDVVDSSVSAYKVEHWPDMNE